GEGKSTDPKPVRDVSGPKRCSAESGVRAPSEAPSRASEPVAELQPGLARVVCRLLPGKTHAVHYGRDALKVRVLDVPVMSPKAGRPVIFLEHERAALAAASLRFVGRVADAAPGCSAFGTLQVTHASVCSELW